MRLVSLAVLSLCAISLPCHVAVAQKSHQQRPQQVAKYDPSNISALPKTQSKSIAVFDASSGQLLWSYHGRERRFPASTTKILTALLFAEATQPSDRVTCKNGKTVGVGGSSLNIKLNESFTADAILTGLILKSANDAGIVMAEHVDGSVNGFAKHMTQRARELGALDTAFMNPHGLHNVNHYTTAIDLGKIAIVAMKNPWIDKIIRRPSSIIKSSIRTQIRVTSKAKSLFFDKFTGADGVKTGYTVPAGNCFIGSATRDGRRYVSVVMGSPDSACKETIPILSWTFRRFKRAVCLPQGSLINVLLPDSFSVKAATTDPVYWSIDTLQTMTPPTQKIVPSSIRMPVKENDIVGHVDLLVDGTVIGSTMIRATQDFDSPTTSMGTIWVYGGIVGLVLVAWKRARRIARRAFTKGPSGGRG